MQLIYRQKVNYTIHAVLSIVEMGSTVEVAITNQQTLLKMPKLCTDIYFIN